MSGLYSEETRIVPERGWHERYRYGDRFSVVVSCSFNKVDSHNDTVFTDEPRVLDEGEIVSYERYLIDGNTKGYVVKPM